MFKKAFFVVLFFSFLFLGRHSTFWADDHQRKGENKLKEEFKKELSQCQSSDTVEKLIELLGHARWRVREMASLKLTLLLREEKNVSSPTYKKIVAQAHNPDPEIRIRIRHILEKTHEAMVRRFLERRILLNQEVRKGTFQRSEIHIVPPSIPHAKFGKLLRHFAEQGDSPHLMAEAERALGEWEQGLLRPEAPNQERDF